MAIKFSSWHYHEINSFQVNNERKAWYLEKQPATAISSKEKKPLWHLKKRWELHLLPVTPSCVLTNPWILPFSSVTIFLWEATRVSQQKLKVLSKIPISVLMIIQLLVHFLIAYYIFDEKYNLMYCHEHVGNMIPHHCWLKRSWYMITLSILHTPQWSFVMA